MTPWYVSIEAPFGGYAPGYWENANGAYGNRNQARSMSNIDMADPTGFKQGPGLANLTNGTEAGVVTTLIKHILGLPPSSDTTYAVGGAKLYQLSSTAVTSSGTWPHTIDKAAVTGEDGESVAVINGALYYFYNHSGSAGDIGKYDLSATFDDDWGSTVPTGAAALQNAPHPCVVGNDNVLYFGNGPYIGYYDPDSGAGGTLSEDDFDAPTGSQCVDVRYLNSRVYGAFNFPNTSGNNATFGIIYVWGGVGYSSWDDYPNPRIQGKIGAIYPFDSTIFVWYQELGFTGGYKLGYISGNQLVEVCKYSGSLPNFAQVGEKDGMIAWISDGLIHRWGAIDRSIPVTHSQYADAGYATAGGMASPFGTIMCATYDGASAYKLAQFSGYDVNSNWKSLYFQVGPSMVDRVRVHHAPTATGARVDLTLRRDQALGSLSLNKQGQTGSITHTNDSSRAYKTFEPKYEVQSEVSIEASYANGSTTNPLQIRRIEMWGHSLDKT